MMYSFQAKDGSVIEREYPMGEAPSVGESIKVLGVKYTRIFDRPMLNPHIGKPITREQIESISAPTESNAKLWGLPPPEDGYSPDGKARFRSNAAKKRYAERCETEDGKVIYDP